MFPGRRIFPLRFLLRHYPVRSQAHGERKVFTDRRPRFVAQELARGWHLQYDSFVEGTRFLRTPATLTEFDPVEARVTALLGHRGVEDLVDRLDSLAKRLARRDDGLRTLRKELGRRHEALAHADHRIENLTDELNRKGDRIMSLDGEVEQGRNEIERLATEVGAYHQEISRLQQEIQALCASKSWRWTAPLRAIHQLINRP